MAKANMVGALPTSRIGQKKLLLLMIIVVIAFTIDSQIGYIADFIPDRLATNEGIALFIGIAVVFAVGGILILRYVKTVSKESQARALHLHATHIGVTIAYYILIANIAFVIAQILITSQYNTVTLAIALYLSYGLWIITLALLTRAFLSWFISSRRNVTVSKRNVMVLILALSMIAYVVNGVIGLASSFDMLAQQKLVITSKDIAFFPDFSIASLGSQIGLANQIASGIAYVLTWIGTAKLLYPHIKKVGQNQVLDYNGCCYDLLSYLISSFCFRILYSISRCRRDGKYPYFFTWWNIHGGRIRGGFLISSKNSTKRKCSEKAYDTSCLWLYSFLYCWVVLCCPGSLSTIWTWFYILYWVIMLFDIFRALFFSSYSFSRYSPASLN